MSRGRRRTQFPVPGFWIAGVLVWLVGTAPGAHALSLDARAVAAAAPVPGGVRRVTGRVLSTASARDPDGVLRTRVTVGDPAGVPLATFSVPGGREGRVLWVVDGVPTFEVGEAIDVELVEHAGRSTLSDDPEALVRTASAPAVEPPTIEDLAPFLAGAVPDSPVEVAVTGTGFGAVQGDSRATFQGLFGRVDAPVLSWSDTAIHCLVPAPGLRGTPQVLSGPIKVWTAAGGWSDGDEFVGGPRFRVLYQWAGDAYTPNRLPVPVYLNPDGFPFGAAAGELVRQALAAWDTPGSYAHLVYRGLTFAEAGNQGDDLTRMDGRNTVRWRVPWPHNASWIAVTWSAIDTLTFERLETELEINGEKSWTIDPETHPESFDLPSTMVHEFGHWLRLGHTQSIASAMLGFQVPGVRRREISPADRFGASHIYPSFGVIEVPGALASGAVVELRIQALDREGSPLASVPAGDIVVRAVPVGRATGEASIPGPLEPAIGGGMPFDHALSATDQDGWTSAVIAGLSDGKYRIEVAIGDRFVRPSPVVTIGSAPAGAAPALSFAGVAPQPLRAGTRGVVRFELPASSHVRIDLFDVHGRRVREIANQRFGAGPQEFALWTGDERGVELSAGVYFIRMASIAGAAFEPRTARLVVLP